MDNLTVAAHSSVTGIFDYYNFYFVGVIYLFAGGLKMLSTEISLIQLSVPIKRKDIFYTDSINPDPLS